ncbi:acyl-[ACP]--phospholipid O-acyltransferase [Terasakiella pusilla]|uniref:acyl-[ACP]--phospholipid O-acyltransferase n=1 Tax=Terasakiella pusilla TaxID=64973 RepID=UPI003AA7BEE9
MQNNLRHLLKTRRFLPLFVAQFFGAFNDNLFKNALVLLISFRLMGDVGSESQILITLAAGLFILPFFLFSALAGQVADKFEKARLIKFCKLAEIAIMALGTAALVSAHTSFLLATLFLMGTQSAFFGPLKYAILPAHLGEKELVGGNGLIEAATFIAILSGSLAAGVLMMSDQGVTVVSVLLMVCAILGFAFSLSIPKAGISDPSLKINPNFVSETFRIVSDVSKNRPVFLSILGISWFWLVGATYLSQFPTLAKDVLGGDEAIVTLFLTLFSLGIALGSVLCNRLLAGQVSAKYVPFAAIGMAVFSFDLYLACEGYVPAVQNAGLISFVSQLENVRLIADLLALAICGGLYIVPLYAIMQQGSAEDKRARVVAANNILNALFMVVSAGVVTGMLAMGASLGDIFLLMMIGNVIAALYICKLLSFDFLRVCFGVILKALYRVEVKGLENMVKAGKRAVIVVNHVSFLDGVLLGAFLPNKPMFAINTQMATKWWVKPFLKFVDAFALDPRNPMATKALINEVKKDKQCVIFPEGRITLTGALMKIYEGPGMIADKADADLVPVRIDGAQFSIFSKLRGKLRLRWFPKITITIQEPRRFDVAAEVMGRARRQKVGAALYDEMSGMIFETCNRHQTLFSSLLEAREIFGKKAEAVEDIERAPLSYDRLVLGSFVLAKVLKKRCATGAPVGVLLPNSNGAVVTFFALQAAKRVPAMLNFSVGSKNMISACQTACIQQVLTSRRFVEMAKLQEAVDQLAEHVEIIYLEDVKADVSLADKLSGLMARTFPSLAYKGVVGEAEQAAVILFTSGSEGAPKAVVLSHKNLQANRLQLGARVDFNPQDTVFNALPVFHSFGLTGGTLLPILSGVKTFMYPSPLHYRIVPELVYDTNSTIMFGTDTFLRGYGRVAHPYDFYSVRYLFAGAEKVQEETRKIWSEKFGIRILEGYGATETAPVIATNTPMHFKAETVGRLLPAIQYKLEPVDGIVRGGRLIVKGPNVMLGYMKESNPGVLEAPDQGWYDTGDIVEIDEEGFLKISGRAKRFAKIAGEMVSLGAVEAHAAEVWPDAQHGVVAVPDARKGEQLVLVTDHQTAERADLLAYAKEQGLSELMVPKVIHPVDKIPLLGTGKIDYVSIRDLVG